MTVSVLLVDDEALVRAALRAILTRQPDLRVVGEAGDGAAAVVAADRLRPDVVLMDVRMPGMDGIDATRRILRDTAEPPRILLLTTFDQDGPVHAALHAGAHGFLLKRAQPAEIVHAVRLAAAGDTLLFPAAIRRFTDSPPADDAQSVSGQGIRADPWPGARGIGRGPVGPLGRLSGRETDVLRLICRGMTNTEIAADLGLTVGTVKTHVAGVLAKLQARDRTQAVIVAYESGFVRHR